MLVGRKRDAEGRTRGPRRAGAAPTRPQEPLLYKVVDSHFGGNRRLTGTGTGARLEYEDIPGYLHPVAGSDAATVGAGLFTKPRG